MDRNQPLWPSRWLMTDERLGERLWQVVEALPEDGGIVFRHYSLPREQRRKLGLRLAAVASERGLVLAVAASRSLAAELGAALVHNPDGAGPLPASMAVHAEKEAVGANEAGAALAFVGPVHRTRSHPDRAVLGLDQAARLAAMAECPAIALGGMDELRFRDLESAFPGVFHGYAGIDCWLASEART